MAGTDNHLLVHRSASKQKFYSGSEPIFWSKELRCWMACDPAVIESIQKNPLFRVVDHSGETAKIVTKLGIDLSHIARVFEHVPVNVEGAEHGRRRRAMATAMATRTEPALTQFRISAERLCHRFFGQTGTVELVSQFFEPLIAELAQALSGVQLEHHPDFVSPTQVFDKGLGLSRRKLINAQIGRLRSRACAHMPDDQADMAVALAILGSDTILGSIALSFAAGLASHPSVPLSDIDWGDSLRATAVPFIERLATAPAMIANAEIEAGDLVRLYLDRYTLEPEERRDGFFGAGRHACLGRAVAQRSWLILTDALRSSTATVTIDDIVLREADCMFLFPREMKAKVDAG